MTTITIIGSGNMARAIGGRAAKHGHTVEVMARNPARAEAVATEIGNGATAGEFGARPAGDVVVLAVPYSGAVDVVRDYGDALSGKVLVDITNPFNSDGSGLETTAGDSITERIAAVAPDEAHVVKAFNTIFGGVLAADRPMDALLAGDTAAKAAVAPLLESLDMRPRDVGGVEMGHALEWAGLILMGVARNGGGFEVALGARAL